MKLWPRDLFVPSVAITICAVAVLVGALFYVTQSADRSAQGHEEAVVANAMNVRVAEIAEDAWSEIAEGAAQHLGPQSDLDRVHSNLGAPLNSIHGFELAFGLDPFDRAIYAMDRGERIGIGRFSAFAASAAPLVASVRQLEGAPRQDPDGFEPPPIQASAVSGVDGHVYVLTASLTGRVAPSLGAARSPIVITAQEVDSEFLSVLSDSLLLDNLTLLAGDVDEGAGKARILLFDASGAPVATFEWWPQTPGTALLQSVLPPVLVLIAGLSALGWALLQRIRRAARKLVASEARATHLAYHDALTGLPNRLLLADRLGRAVEDLRRRRTPFAVHCIDLDRFKDVNDTHGHQAGDELIRLAAKKISTACRQADTIARLGGDEFAIVQIGADLNGVGMLAERLVALLAEPMDLSVGRVFIGGSVGVSLFTEDAVEPQDCLHQADLALYRAKERGGGDFCFFEPEMDVTVRSRKALQADLRDAIAQEQLYLVYQPQVDGRGRTIGVEALLRWNHPTRGALLPGLFVPVAEESGLIDSLGFFALRRAFEDGRRWPNLKISVNISAVQLRMKDFPGKLAELVTATGIDPAGYELEITEGVLLGDDPQTHETLRKLRELGFTLALDDFGTGYSSLSYLQRYPIDRIKIDRSFVTNLGVDKDADAVVSAIVRLAHALNLDVIAEGVETNEQRLCLVRAGCTDAQGFLFGKPSSVEVIDALVAAEHLAVKRPITAR